MRLHLIVAALLIACAGLIWAVGSFWDIEPKTAVGAAVVLLFFGFPAAMNVVIAIRGERPARGDYQRVFAGMRALGMLLVPAPFVYAYFAGSLRLWWLAFSALGAVLWIAASPLEARYDRRWLIARGLMKED